MLMRRCFFYKSWEERDRLLYLYLLWRLAF